MNFLDSLAFDTGGTLWLGGLGGVAARKRPGHGFETLDTGTDALISHVVAHPSGTVLMLGDDGAIIQRAPGPDPAE